MRSGRLARAPLFLLAAGISVGAFSLTFTHLAGSFGGPGFEDGPSADARFKSDAAIAVDGSGNVYVADTANYTIRKIAPGGEVTTLAGLAETTGSTDGHGAHATFRYPAGIAVDGSGLVYVADTENHTIRKITAAGDVTTFVGYPGAAGYVNASGFAARFNNPHGLALDGSGNLYVSDTGNHSIRKVTPAGAVTTLAGTGSFGSTNDTGTAASFTTPLGIAYDSFSNALYVADSGNRVVRRITLPGAVVTTFAGTMGVPGHGDGIPGFLFTPSGITADGTGNLYVSDSTDHSIRSITSGGSLGSAAGFAFYPGPDDGTGAIARFRNPAGIAALGATALFVADTGNHTVRKIALSGGGNVVSTYAGLANAPGFTNATGSAARFNSPSGISYYPGISGFAYVADTGNDAIRKVGVDGVVTTLAGGIEGYANGLGAAARFRNPQGLAMNFSDQSAYIADTDNHCIRLMDLFGNVSLYAGQPTVSGNANGDRLTTASFNAPRAVALNAFGTALYVADTGNFLVRKINLSTGAVTTLAGSGTFGSTNANGTSASFGVMTGIMVDSSENVYVAESVTYTIRKITSSGDVTTLAGACCNGPVDGTGTAARFGYPGPTGISGRADLNTALVADPRAHLLRTITLDAGVVGTAGGKANVNGTSDGTGTFARFNGASAVSYNGSAAMFVEGHTIRYGGPELSDRAVIDSANGLVGTARQLDVSPSGASSWSWTIIRRPSGSTATLSATNIRNPTFTPDVPDLYVFRCVATGANGSSISTVSLQGNGPAVGFTLSYPGPLGAGIAQAVPVFARDAYANQADGYTGTVHFTSSDGTATLPADYTYTLADHGLHSFNITLRHSGLQTVTVTDTVTGSITGTGYFNVNPGSAASLVVTMASPAGSGNPADVTVTAKDSFNNTAINYSGTIHFTSSDGAATLPSNYTFVTLDAGTHTFSGGVTLRTGGVQTVTATDTVTGSITGFATVTVGPPTPVSFTANGTASQVFLAWNPSSGADHYDVYRASTTSGGYAFLISTPDSFYTDAAVSASTVYAYKVRAVDASANASPFSIPDAATTIVFTDDPLVASTTPIKAIHITQARQAVDALRACAGLTAGSYTDPSLVVGTTLVKATHIQQLRTGLTDARALLGLPTITFTDSTLTVGTTVVKRLHVADLRTGVK